MTVNGERWIVTASKDWAKDLMLEGLSLRRERAALARGLDQLETQLARRKNERVARALAEMRERRRGAREDEGASERGGGARGGREGALPTPLAGGRKTRALGGFVPGPGPGPGGLRRSASVANDLAGELEELTEEEWAHIAALAGGWET